MPKNYTLMPIEIYWLVLMDNDSNKEIENNMRRRNLPTILFSFLMLTSCSCSIFAPGNDSKYSPSNCELKTNILNDKTMYWLGSSVTLGMESGEQAVAEYLKALDGINYEKEAKSGTTLKGTLTDDSYASRLISSKKFDKSQKIDAFICQLSTNDAKKVNVSTFGEVSSLDTLDLEDFDIGTTIGAMEYVINYVHETWNCPIYFYTNAYISDSGKKSISHTLGSDYKKLIDLSYEVIDKYNSLPNYQVRIIDMFDDEEFNDISDEKYELYMFDAIHPTKAGYLEWWTPFFENYFLNEFGE